MMYGIKSWLQRGLSALGTGLRPGRIGLPLIALTLACALGAGPARAETILFIGNSYTHGAQSPVWKYRPDTVTDLNAGGVGGVPALFKAFTDQAGLDFTVSLETIGGSDLGRHLREKRDLIDRSWDHVILQSFSTIDQAEPGNPTRLVSDAAEMGEMFHARNPQVNIKMIATWSRADQTYLTTGHWYGQPIGAMAKEVRAAYDLAAAGSPHINEVIAVGEAWNRAFDVGFADSNPYDGIQFGQVNLWTNDHHHASAYGYYLEALMVFGAVTGADPRTLGERETAAMELGFSPAQTAALQQIAYDELAHQRQASGS